jgi:hypothetical protein
MKKYITILVATLFLVSCENTNENLVQERGVAVAPIMSEPFPAAFIISDLTDSYVAFDLSLPEGTTIEKAAIEIAYNNKSVILKEITIPVSNLKITATEIFSALGISENDVTTNDTFFLYVLTTKDGKTTRSIAAISINVVCGFDETMTAGAYNFVSEDWDEAGAVTLEADPNDPYKIAIAGLIEAQGLSGNGNKVVLNINPNNYNVSGSKVVLANAGWGYTNVAFEPLAGTFNVCDGTYTVTFAISVDQGSFGNYIFVFTRPQ